MSQTRMDIRTIVVGGGPVASLLVLQPYDDLKESPSLQLPIRIGPIEATSISLGMTPKKTSRPITHDLTLSLVRELGGTLERACLVDVEGTTFYAKIYVRLENDDLIAIDARPSDAIALAVRAGAAIYAEDDVLSRAALPDFSAVEKHAEKESLAQFHQFLEDVAPDDFSSDES